MKRFRSPNVYPVSSQFYFLWFYSNHIPLKREASISFLLSDNPWSLTWKIDFSGVNLNILLFKCLAYLNFTVLVMESKFQFKNI